MVYSIKRFTRNRKEVIPGYGTIVGKQWIITSEQKAIGRFVFNPAASFYFGSSVYAIEPVPYKNHKGAFSNEEHLLLELGKDEVIQRFRLTCKFSAFRKAKFHMVGDGKKMTLKGPFRAWSTPSLNTSITASVDGQEISATSEFLGPEGEFDCVGKITCESEEWEAYIFTLLFFLEMDMMQTIEKVS